MVNDPRSIPYDPDWRKHEWERDPVACIARIIADQREETRLHRDHMNKLVHTRISVDEQTPEVARWADAMIAKAMRHG